MNSSSLLHRSSLGLPSLGLALCATLCTSLMAGCDFDSDLADRTTARVVVDGASVVTTDNDMGYRVELSRCRVAIDTLELTTDGQMHASLLDPFWDLAIPNAYAHPGHEGGGEVVGELAGRHVFDWRDDGALVGEATLLAANYSGANFSFTRARLGDGIPADDPIIGHTFEIVGTATLDDERWEFTVLLDQDEGRRVVGLPLELDVDGSPNEDFELGLQLLVDDPIEQDTLFDGIDFALLDDDGDHVIVIEPDTEAYNRLRRNTQAHDHYGVVIHP
ncbi:MAG: hypothetical protein AAGF11_42540 [Myxococcota bacterium]